MKQKPVSPYFLLFAAFTEGAVLMSLEILSSKIIAPYYGSSLYVWTAVLGITMGGLAVGYFLGGVFSENKINKASQLMIMLAAAAFLMLLLPYTSHWIMQSTLGIELRAGIFISCFVFMLPPIVIFGMVSPIIIRMLTTTREKIGLSSGLVYSVSTAGGILFTFLTGFYFISSFGIKNCTRMLCVLLLAPPLIYFVNSLFKKTHAH
jgi:hypothetical protein